MTLLLLLLAACTGEATFDRTAMLTDTVEGVIAPTHADLVAGAGSLDTAAAAHCASPTVATLESARAAWLATKEPLKRIQAWSFGPYRNFGIEIAKNVDKWPGYGENIEAIVAGEDEITVEYVASLDYTTRVKGYPALEYLLWTDATWEDRRCAYLTALTAHGLGIVTDYTETWEPYGAQVAEPTGSDAFGTEQVAVTALVTGLLSALSDVSMMKLGKPLGDQDGGTALPTEVEAPFSGTSLQHAHWTLDGVEAIYLAGLTDLVRSREAEGAVDDLVRARIGEARTALEAVPEPLETAVVEDPDAVRAAIVAVDALAIVLSGEVSTLLGINPSTVEGDND